MLAVQEAKLKSLAELPGKRVVLIGGSGLGMGMCTSDLSAKLGRSVYNVGLHGGLGLVYQLKSVMGLLRTGDVAVLVPEYSNFDGSTCFGNMELVALLADILPEHKTFISFIQWVHLLEFVPDYGATKLRKLFVASSDDNSGSNYDEFGDSRWVLNKADAQVVFPVAKPTNGNEYDAAAVEAISEFINECKRVNVKVVLLPPAYQASSYDRQEEFILRVARELKQQSMPFLADPKRYRLDDRFFYDTPYHLNLEGRKLRTKLVYEDLRRVL